MRDLFIEWNYNDYVWRVKPEEKGMSRDEASRYHTLLRDPTRRKIIEILGEQGKSGFKELRSSLGLGVGTVYYHLDMLSDFLIQDKNRKYMLNDRGQLLYRSLKDGSVPHVLSAGEALGHRVGRWVFLSPIFFRMTRLEVLLPVSVAILFLGAVGTTTAEATTPVYKVEAPSGINQIDPRVLLPLTTTQLAIIVVGALTVIAVSIYVIKWKRKTPINMVGAK